MQLRFHSTIERCRSPCSFQRNPLPLLSRFSWPHALCDTFPCWRPVRTAARPQPSLSFVSAAQVAGSEKGGRLPRFSRHPQTRPAKSGSRAWSWTSSTWPLCPGASCPSRSITRRATSSLTRPWRTGSKIRRSGAWRPSSKVRARLFAKC